MENPSLIDLLAEFEAGKQEKNPRCLVSAAFSSPHPSSAGENVVKSLVLHCQVKEHEETFIGFTFLSLNAAASQWLSLLSPIGIKSATLVVIGNMLKTW